MRRFRALVVRLLLLLTAAILLFNAVMVGLRYQAAGIIILLWLTWRRCRRWRVSGAFGTARVGGLRDLLSANMLADHGLILGRVGHSGRPTRGQAVRSLLSPGLRSERAVRMCFDAFIGVRRADDFIRINDYVHLGTFAPSGGGKSVSNLIPNLLSFEGNCVVLDPKGELYELTHRHRQERFGHTIVRLDPAGLCGPGAACFNPLDWINPQGEDFIGQCRDLANMIVVRTGLEHDPHFNDSAENVIAAFIGYVCAFEGDPNARNLRGVRCQLASRANYEAALERMQTTEGFHGVLEQLGQSMSWHVDRELGSVMSTAQRHTNIFGDPMVDSATWRSSFDPGMLRAGGRMTLYIVIPADRLVVWQPLLRVWLGSLLRIVTRGRPTEKNPVLFLVDECAQVGRMQALEDAVTLLRGSGIRMWLFFQSLNQLQKCFGDNAQTVLDNLATQQYMSVTSFETAEAISKRIGDQTVVIRSEGHNRGVSMPFGGDARNPGSRSSGSNSNTSEVARRLIRPEEILVLPENAAIVFHKNNYVIVCDKIKYYADRAFRLRGIVHHRWGTGRTRGLNLAEVLLGIAVLTSAFGVTTIVARLPVLAPPRPPAASGRVYSVSPRPPVAPGFYRPNRRSKHAAAKSRGRRPLPSSPFPSGFRW